MRTGLISLADLLPPERVTWLEEVEKDEALRTLLGLISNTRAVADPAELERAILGREVLMSTGVGYGVAVPHAKIPTVRSFVLAMGISATGIPYRSLVDDQPVRLIVMIASPDSAQEGYLKVLSTLMKFIKSEKGKILTSGSAAEISRFASAYPLEIPPSALPAG
jgi:mannitol/fructose-specific phosphotransferase system IIA component (Ntr-type)